MNTKSLILTFFLLFAFVASASSVSAISTYVYWADGTTSFQTVDDALDLNFNYTTVLASTHSSSTVIKLIANNDYANPVATVLTVSATGINYGPGVVSNNLLQGNTQYTLWAQATDTTTTAQDFDLLDFQTLNHAPEFNTSMVLYYQYDIALVQNVNVVDLSLNSFDVDGDTLSYSIDESLTNLNIFDCQLTGTSTDMLNCDLFSVGTSSLVATVSDGSLSDDVTVVIEVINSTTPNTAPTFDPNMTLYYSYDINLNSVQVVDLATVASDLDLDPLTFSLNTAATNTGVVGCSLTSGSVLGCNLNGIGTTTLDAIVSDGSLTDTVTITLNVYNGTPVNNAPYFNSSMSLYYSYNLNLNSVQVVDLSLFGIDPDADPLTYSINTAATNSAVTTCSLLGGSVIDCTLNGVGTTTLTATVSDGSLTSTVTITLNVYQITPQNNAPYFNSTMSLYYSYNLAAGNVNVVDLSLFGVDPDFDPLTYSISTAATNSAVTSCSLLGGSLINCNLNGVGTTTLTATVSDGSLTDTVTITLNVYQIAPPNNPPYFNASMQLTYVYDLALVTQATVVDLSLFGLDADNDPLTYGISTTATNPAVTTCNLVGGSVVNCVFNGVGTTGFSAQVFDGQATTAVQVTIIVINSTPANNAPYYVNLNTVTTTPTGMQFVYDLQGHSFDPDFDPTTNSYSLSLTNPTIINWCMIVGTGQLYCNVVGTGSTSIAISVTDGQATTWDVLPIIVNPVPNNPPYFTTNLSSYYSYDVNLGTTNVVDLALFSIDADGDALTFSLDQTATNLSVVNCSLNAGSMLTCSLNAVGTTTVMVAVTDGQATTYAQLTINVYDVGPHAPIAIISSPGDRLVCTSGISYSGAQSYSPDGTLLVSHHWAVLDLAGNVVAQASSPIWSTPNCLPEGRYTVYLTVVDANGLVGSAQKLLRVYDTQDFSNSDEEGLKVMSVEAWGTDFEEACIGSCGSNQVELVALVENTRNFDIKGLRMTYTIPEYGIKYISDRYDIDAGDMTTIELLIELPMDIEPGVYYPTFSFSDGEIRRVKPSYLEILG